jgi:methylase of polypeptide subunit release factors
LETDERVRVSLILSFGRVAGPEDTSLLKLDEARSDAEKDALNKVLDRFRGLTGSAGHIDTLTALEPGIELELWCRAGISDILTKEAREQNLDAIPRGKDRVAITTVPNLAAVARLRSALYPVIAFQADTDNPATMGKMFANSQVVRQMIKLTQDEKPHYRITSEMPTIARVRKRDWISAFAAEVRNLKNAATGYSWELIIRQSGQRTIIGARPMLPDNRFHYRKRDVPASLHPTLAAAAVRASPMQNPKIVLDPFCGSGTLLAESAIRYPNAKMTGIDIDERALRAARENLKSFEQISLIRADSTVFDFTTCVDLIISNPPYGQRVSDRPTAKKLHRFLDGLASRVLRPGGYLVVFRPPEFPDPQGLSVLTKIRVDAGGIPINLFVAKKV